MTHPTRSPLLAIVLITFAVTAPVSHAAAEDELEPIDRIVAVVNETVILASELDEEVQRTRNRLKREDTEVPPVDVLRERALDQLIDRRVQVQRAKRRGMSVNDRQINSALRRMAEDRGTDLSGLRRRYEQSGRSFEQLREQVREQLLIRQLRQRAVTSQIQVSDQEVADFVDRLSKASEQRAQFRLRHILIQLPGEPSPEQIQRAREKAAGLVERLRGDADFADVATRVSDGPRALEGGDLGWRNRAQLPSLFVDAVESLEKGKIAEPVRSSNGLHVLKLVDRRGGQDQTVTEYNTRHILLRGDDDARATLASLRRRLRRGEAKFAELARSKSDDPDSAERGGRLGWIGPGDMPPAFMRVVQQMSAGELSEPFRSPLGWHLVKLTDRRERTDVEAYRRAQARQTLYRRKRQEQTQRWLRKLRAEAFIEKRLEQ
jgi:peptidyl-prolyl cis-trans isomerase SurA